MTNLKKTHKYVQVGVGARSAMYYEAIAKNYLANAEIVGFCDINRTRLNFASKTYLDLTGRQVPTYLSKEFDLMVKKTKPDSVIVTSIDRTHHYYIVRAMELGCDVITEKPMTIDIEKCQEILDTINRTNRKLTVTFNYRYMPRATKLRELLMKNTIGKIFSVHFEWLLDLQHGADYFRRWHRDKRNSGGLLVHKSTLHFDLVNYWLQDYPQTVMAFGDLRYYGRANAEARGITEFYSRSHGSEFKQTDPFTIDLANNKKLRSLYLDAEKDDGYIRDQSVFSDGISIEDTAAVLVRYDSGALMTYSLNAYQPWEGFRLSLTGSKGRIELLAVENSYISASGKREVEGSANNSYLKVSPHFEKPYIVDIPKTQGGHGGGDPELLKDIFSVRPPKDIYNRSANHIDGSWSILTGIAANKSIQTGLPVNIDNLIAWH